MMGILPYTTTQYEVAVEPDVIYARAEGYWKEAPSDPKEAGALRLRNGGVKTLDLDMDIYIPEGDRSAKRPLLMLMHGGALYVGNKNELWHAEWCKYFASLGYVAVSINYRMGFNILSKKDISMSEVRALEDADAAMAYLLGRDDLRIDPGRVFVAGTSSGAITALHMAFRAPGSHPRIRAVGNLWGAVHDLSVLELSDTPVISFQSAHDPVVPYDEGYVFPKYKWLPARLFYDKMYGTHAVHERALELGILSEHHSVEDPRHHIQHDEYGNLTSVFYEIRGCMAHFFAKVMYPEDTI